MKRSIRGHNHCYLYKLTRYDEFHISHRCWMWVYNDYSDSDRGVGFRFILKKS